LNIYGGVYEGVLKIWKSFEIYGEVLNI
jgi:hypothetical protein